MIEKKNEKKKNNNNDYNIKFPIWHRMPNVRTRYVAKPSVGRPWTREAKTLDVTESIGIRRNGDEKPKKNPHRPNSQHPKG